MYVGGNAVEINADAADSNDVTECPFDYKSTTGIFIFVSDFTQCPKN